MFAYATQAFVAVRSLIRETIDGYMADRGDLMAAALAFYTLLAIAPLVLIVTVVASFVLGTDEAQAEISRLLQERFGAEASATVRTMVDGFAESSQRSGRFASVIAGGLTLFTASKLVQQVRRAMNQIWNVEDTRDATAEFSVWHYARQRAFGFVVVLSAVPILIVVFASRAILSGLGHVLLRALPFPGIVVQALQLGLSVILVWAVTALIFRYVPQIKLDWPSTLVGALVTSLIFNLGNIAVGLYLGRASMTSTYGAAGALFVVPFWLKLSASMFMFGAELTQVCAARRSRRRAQVPPESTVSTPSGAGRNGAFSTR